MLLVGRRFSETENTNGKMPLPNKQARYEILKIHASGITKHGDIDYEQIVKLSTFNGADLSNVCRNVYFRADREYVIEEYFCYQRNNYSIF